MTKEINYITAAEIQKRIDVLSAWLDKVDPYHYLFNIVRIEKASYERLLTITSELEQNKIPNKSNGTTRIRSASI